MQGGASAAYPHPTLTGTPLWPALWRELQARAVALVEEAEYSESALRKARVRLARLSFQEDLETAWTSK